jgi:hypothetical protein
MEHNTLKLNEAVIQLHDVARSVTKELGLTTLSLDIRECAERLNELMKTRNNNE